MFYNGSSTINDGRISVIGEFSKVDGEFVVLKVGKSMLRVKHNGLDNYRTKYILVAGNYENGYLVEEKTQKIEDDFDYQTFLKLANSSSKYSDIF